MGFVVLMDRYNMRPKYKLNEVMPPSIEPVSREELKLWLNISSTAFDPILDDPIKSARKAFERKSKGRIVHPTRFRQWFTDWCTPITLYRASVSAVHFVKYIDPNGAAQTLSDDEYGSETAGIVGSLYLVGNTPSVSSTAPYPYYVEYTAGWDVGQAPADVKIAIRGLAGHYLRNRESHGDKPLNAVPMQFTDVANAYSTGLFWMPLEESWEGQYARGW